MLIAALIVSWAARLVRTALNTVERTRIEEHARSHNRRAATLLRLLDNPPRSLEPVRLVDGLALLVIATDATWQAASSASGVSSLVSTLLIIFVIWLVGRIIVDLIAAANAASIAEASAPVLAVLVSAARPLQSLEAWLTHRARGASHRTTERVTSDDIQIIVTEGNQERKLEEIEPEEREMIAGIIEMSERTARDIMVPRPDAIFLEVGSSIDQALDIGSRYGHSRLPVYEGDIDHVVGILHIKDLIQSVRHPERKVVLRDLLRPVHYVPDIAKADDLLRDLMYKRVHMAVVVDEYGGTAGIVTIEDALEEIVGEIRDEYDTAEEPEYVRTGEDEAVFKGRVPIAEVNDLLSIQLPTDESDTLGGLLYSLLERMPKTGDRAEAGSAELQVVSMNGRRVSKVRVRKLAPAQSTGDRTEQADA
ncbi:MAG: hemolysin family protein [Rudaea sp.]